MRSGNGQLDRRVAGDRIVELAQWWTQASQEARFELLRRVYGTAPQKDDPSQHELRLAIIAAEIEAGETGEG